MKFNDPPVLNFISVHGPHAGVAGVPRCDPGDNAILKGLCDLLDLLLGDFVYTPAIQSSIAQSNYFRDPLKISEYLSGSAFLPFFLENPPKEYRDRFVQIKKLVLIMAKRDTMIFPKESEYFGAFQDGGWSKIIPGNEQPWYETLGLKEMDQNKKIVTLTTEGDHLAFSANELYTWLDQFFMQ